jgi:hypothetical protein
VDDLTYSHQENNNNHPQKEMTPQTVVWEYLQAWNESRFAVEFKHLARKNRTLSLEDYCERRRAVKAAQIGMYGKATVQEIARMDSYRIEGEDAEVEITRLDRTNKGIRCYAQFFELRKEEGVWRIRMVRDGEERRNPTVPPKGRTMKAGDFAGKENEVKKFLKTE